MYALEILDLQKTYASGTKALKGISFNVKQGDFYALLGPNGAGKSTTIGIITSLVNKTSGAVKIFGSDIDTDFEQAKLNLGLVPQEFNFNQFETVEQILLQQAGYYGIPRKIAKKRAQKYLTQLDLWHKKNEMAKTLSGGMKRRLMIARALVQEPKFLILDEPTAGVDISLRRSMWDFLRDLNKNGITIILTTHYLEEAEMLCRNIGIINQGKIVENTTMKHFLSKLDVETFIFDLANEPQSVPQLENIRQQSLFNGSLEITVDKAVGLNAIFDQLTKLNIQVLSMRNKANRLEELFVSTVHEGK